MFVVGGEGGSWCEICANSNESQPPAGADPELGFWGQSDSFYCLFHARSFLKQLVAIRSVIVWCR